MDETRDIRFGHDLTQVQDDNGTDLTLLEDNLRRSVEERLIKLQQRVNQMQELRAAVKKACT